MLASWSGPFAAGTGDRPGVRVVELSLVESVVRTDLVVARLVLRWPACLHAALGKLAGSSGYHSVGSCRIIARPPAIVRWQRYVDNALPALRRQTVCSVMMLQHTCVRCGTCRQVGRTPQVMSVWPFRSLILRGRRSTLPTDVPPGAPPTEYLFSFGDSEPLRRALGMTNRLSGCGQCP